MPHTHATDPRPSSTAVGGTRVPTFRSPELDEKFQRDGYVVVPRFSREEVAVLRARWEAMYVGERDDACHRSNESLDLGYRKALHELITETLDPVIEDLLVDHRSFSSGTLVKWKGPNSAMSAHQDWTMVDEPRSRAVSVWMPLSDVDAANGALGVLPGSQHVLTGMRPNPGIPPSLVDPAGGIDPADLPSVEMQAGSCLIFDHGVLHGSPPNTTDEPRVALVLAAAPETATLQHLWRRPEDDMIERFEVADHEFFRHCTPGIRPSHPAITLVETLPFEPHPDRAAAWLEATVRPGVRFRIKLERGPAPAHHASEAPPPTGTRHPAAHARAWLARWRNLPTRHRSG